MLKKIPKKILWMALVMFIVVGGGGYAYYNAVYLPAQTPDEPGIQITTVRQGDLVIFASGSGTLITTDEIYLGFGTNGLLAELYVRVGDEVHEGDILAVQGNREQLEATVAADQLAVMNAQQALDDIYARSDVVRAQAQLDLANAMDKLHSSEVNWSVQQEGNRASQATLDAAEAELEIAKVNLDRAEQNLNQDPDNEGLSLNYANAQKKYNTAKLNWNWYTGYPTQIQQAILDAEVAIAEANLANAEREYDRVKDGPDPDQVVKAELQLANAVAKLAVSQSNLDQSIISAPMGGMVMEVKAHVGENASGPFITLADLNQPYLEIFLDETDLDMVDIDYEIEVIFDALPDEVFTGHVVQVDPILYTTGNVSTVHGLVKLDQPSTSVLDRLLIGMNAAVDIIGGKAEGVALVPIEALRELAPGDYAVFVMQDGVPRLRTVEVGLMDFTFAEITSGLEIGEVVTTGIVETE